MKFRTLKPFLFFAAVTIIGLACKEAPSQIETPLEQKSNPVSTEEIATEKVILNPAHGEPAHRCDIAVGQPLNSKPAKEDLSNINPAHGQPGHRCDVPVGAPLPI